MEIRLDEIIVRNWDNFDKKLRVRIEINKEGVEVYPYELINILETFIKNYELDQKRGDN